MPGLRKEELSCKGTFYAITQTLSERGNDDFTPVLQENISMSLQVYFSGPKKVQESLDDTLKKAARWINTGATIRPTNRHILNGPALV